jgi:hypothetical protein
MSDLNQIFGEDQQEIEIADIKSRISMKSLVDFLGCRWDGDHTKIACPFHKSGNERTPSMQINEDNAYCYNCRRSWDVIQFVKEKFDLTFRETKDWFIENLPTIAIAVKEPVTHRRTKRYIGPAPRSLVDFWFSCLTPEHRVYLHEERMLSDAIINTNKIGWRPDYCAYSIPFWRGLPGKSEADIVQFRSTKNSPLVFNKDWRYMGLGGHNRSSVINTHLVTPGKKVVIFFGTFDALLAGQDGIIALSINGASTFMREQDSIERLKAIVAPASRVYVVPDKQDSEVEPAYRTAEMLGAEVKHFPITAPGKDYTEYRLAGKKPFEFLVEVLGDPNQMLFFDDLAITYLDTLLLSMFHGDNEACQAWLSIFEERMQPGVLCYGLQVRTEFDPNPIFSFDEWAQFHAELPHATQYINLRFFFAKWAEIALANQGGF